MRVSEVFYYIISLSLMGSILAAGLLIIKALLGQRLGAKWHYGIWFVLVVRLLIPYIPSSPANVLSFIPHYQQVVDLPQISMPSVIETNSSPSGKKTDNITVAPQQNLSGNTNTKVSKALVLKTWINWKNASIAWLGGTGFILLYVFVINMLMVFKMRKLKRCNSKDVLRILQECKSSLNINANVSVIYDDTLKSPAIFGLFSKKIIISPEIMERLTQDELRYVFMHELSHIKRHDLWMNGLVLVIQAVYWFNPLIWYALHQMKHDCEIACDATALSALKQEDHKKYGQTIISLLQLLSEPHWAPGTLGFVSKFNTRRIIMISTFKNTKIKWAVAALALILLAGCTSLNNPIKSSATAVQSQQTAVTGSTQIDTTQPAAVSTSDSSQVAASSSEASNSKVYKNTQYGFSFALPDAWKGYSIVAGKWEGLAISGESGEKVVQTGPIISIRDPRWTSKTPRQDIPIMVFTLKQWSSLQKDEFHIGAAPIGPSELGRNNAYVFALPARYNFAFLPGYEEVEKIIEGKPLKTFQVSAQTSSSKSLISSIVALAKQGRIINSDFSVKTNTLNDVEVSWGKADKMDWVAAAKGSYATYSSHNAVIGVNKGNQIFELRSFDTQISAITLSSVERALGKPQYDSKYNGEEIIGYAEGSEFKLEMIFAQPSKSNPDRVLDHYNVLYPKGTVNSMADDPGREW